MAGTVIVDKIQLGDGTSGFQVVSNTGTLIFNANSSGQTSFSGNTSIGGNAGIGISSAASRLHVRQDQDGTTRAIVQNRNGSGTPISELTFMTGQIDLSDNRYSYIQSGGTFASYLAFGTSNGATPIEQARITPAGLFQFNSGYGSVATAFGCRAWVNFNGTGTVAIRASGNVSSITDNGVGDYTVNFTNAMPDANYCIAGTGQYDQTGNAANGNAFINAYRSSGALATTSCRIGVTSSGSVFDAIGVYVAIFR